MPASRSRSRSPRRSSSSSFVKEKERKPNSRELITINTDSKDVGSKAKEPASDLSSTNTPSSKVEVKQEKSERKKSEPAAPKSSNSANWTPPPSKTKERKFSARCRLFVGNLLSCSEEELKEMFHKYGQVSEVFINKERGFGFVRLVSMHLLGCMKVFLTRFNNYKF